MDSDFVVSRRSLLRRAFVLAAGAVGLSAVGSFPAEAAAASKPTYPYLVGIKGTEWHYMRSGGDTGEPPENGETAVLIGLLMNSKGRQIGYFRGTSTFVQAEVSGAPEDTMVEQHTFGLPDGNLFGTGIGGAGKRAFAIVGGTGKYAKAGGTYAITESFIELGGTGNTIFSFKAT
jgi:hypothetical protein